MQVVRFLPKIAYALRERLNVFIEFSLEDVFMGWSAMTLEE